MFILHHYQISPYSEMIRLMLGYSNLAWRSAISPPLPPRPLVDPLIGGYRRIPVAQIGADIFCDSRIIASEISKLSNMPELAFETTTPEAKEFAMDANKNVFMPVARTAEPAASLKMVAMKHWPWEVAKLIKDRAAMAKKSSLPRQSRKEMTELMSKFKTTIANKLNTSAYLFGDQPCIADFVAYHIIWFADATRSTRFLHGAPTAQAWQQRMKEIGHGSAKTIKKREVFQTAKESLPRALNPDLIADENIGKSVIIAPNDYAMDSTSGVLVGANEERVIIERDTTEFGKLHIHFPTSGYDIKYPE